MYPYAPTPDVVVAARETESFANRLEADQIYQKMRAGSSTSLW